MNGSINDEYDPYKNAIIENSNNQRSAGPAHITVPFLFTQSGIKPLTSITMSERYVNLYNSFFACDAIAVIGFGFNTDDGHINGLFRELIDDEDITIVMTTHDPNLMELGDEVFELSDGIVI